MDDKYTELYDELVKASEKILPYYDIDKIKSYSVYIWTKGEDGENVFDIREEGIIFYVDNHEIIKEAMPIIEEIQKELKEMRKYIEE